MKKVELIKKVARLNIFIRIFSIICLVLIFLLPWISVQEEDFVKEDLYFNFEMMSKSNNKQIRDLASYLNFIVILLLGLILLGILSKIGSIIYGLRSSSPKGYIFLIIGGAILIFSILILVLQLIFIYTIKDIDGISASAIFPYMNYALIPFLFNILLLIYSIRYFWVVFQYSTQQFTSLKKEKDSDIKQVYKKKSETITKEKPTLEKKSLKSKIDDKRDEIDKLLIAEIKKMEKQPVKKSYHEIKIEDKINLEEIVTPEQSFPEIEPFEIKEMKTEKYSPIQEKESLESYKEIPFRNNNKLEPFLSENKKEEIKKLDDKTLYPSLEEALSSAIQKKQIEIRKRETIKDNIGTLKEEIAPFSREKPVKKKVSVRCPQCKGIFIIEKDEKITNIICPKCGKEGVIK